MQASMRVTAYGTALDRVHFWTVLAATALVSFVLPRSAAVDPADPLLLAAFLLLLLNLPALKFSARVTSLFLLGGFLLFLSASITFLRTNMMGDFLTPFKYLMNTGVVFMVYVAAASTISRWSIIAFTYLGGLCVNAMIALYQVSDRSHHAGCMTQGRACGMTDHPNELAHLLCAGIFISISLMLMYRGPVRLLLWAIIALFVAALAASGSMGATAGLVAGLGVFVLGSLLVRPAITARWLLLLTILSLLAIGPLTKAVEGTKVAERWTQFFEADSIGSTTLGERVDINSAATRYLAEHPITGVGSFRNRLPHPVHNIFLGAWFETGMLGFFGVLIILAATYRNAARALIAMRRWPAPFHAAVAMAAMLVGLLVAAQVAPVGYRRNPWAPYWIAVSQSIIWIRMGLAHANRGRPDQTAARAGPLATPDSPTRPRRRIVAWEPAGAAASPTGAPAEVTPGPAISG